MTTPTQSALHLSRLAMLIAGVVSLSACGGGSEPTEPPAPAPTAPAPAPAPAPSPAPAPAPSACGTLKTLDSAALAAFDGSYAVKVFEGSGAELGAGSLVLASGALQFTPAAGLSGSVAATASVTAICENSDGSGKPIGVVAVIDSQRHLDFFSPAFSGLYVSGSDLGSAVGSGRYLQGTTARNTPAPSPAPAPAPAPTPAPAPAPTGALSSYLNFAAAAPATRSVAPGGALAWLAGSYYGRSAAGPCSVSIQADGRVSASINGSTQSAALDGEAGDTWVQLASNGMNFGVNIVGAGQGVSLTGYAGRLALVEIGGVLDKCAIAFKSETPLGMALAASAPLAIKSSGLLAADLPAWLLGTHHGHVAGSLLYPQTASAACSLTVGGDGSLTLSANGRSYAAQVSGGTGSGDRDSSSTARLSAYTALTGARDWVWSLTAQSPSSGGNLLQLQVELAHNGERSQLSYVEAQVRPVAGGLATQFDACYFPN